MRASSLGLLVLLVSCSGSDDSNGNGAAASGGSSAASGGAGGASVGTGGTNPLAGGATGGRGGAGGSTAGAGGSAGPVDAAPGLTQLPGCLRDLYAGCATEGACQAQKTDAGLPERLCFSSGVKVLYSGEQGCTDRGAMTLVQVRKAGGAPCYTLDISVTPKASACEQAQYTWRNPMGHIVASAMLNSGTLAVQCATTGELFSCMSTGCPPEWFPLSLPACTAGTCL